MKIHVYADGSEGVQYEPNDRVIVKRTIDGGWFDTGPINAERCTVKRIWDAENFPHRDSLKNITWRIAKIEVHYSDEWGFAECYPWMIEPHPEALATAERIQVK